MRTYGCLAVLAVMATPALAAEAPEIAMGRLLASNCFQCHGTKGQPRPGFDNLAGESAAEIVDEMREMARLRPGQEPDKDIMAVHAKTYTTREIDLIARYLATR